MRIPTAADFTALETWGLIDRPLAAIEEYSDEHERKRWENDRHRRAHNAYEENQSAAFVSDSQQYYRTMDRPIDRTKWEYLKRRKAWFQPPLEWNRFAAPDTARILDLGCGDGDQTHRIAEYVSGRWMCAGYDGFPMEIAGIDISQSRVANARKFGTSPHKKLTLDFEQGDVLDGLSVEDDFFDYTTLMGVLEVIDDTAIPAALDEISRITAKGIYVRDILDEYPGMYPRPDLPDMLSERGFTTIERHTILEEPFVENGSKDPLDVWPMNLHQVLFAESRDHTPPEERY